MERPRKELVTIGGNHVVVYSYATGGDYEAIQQCYLQGAVIELDNNVPRVTGLDAAKAESTANETAIKCLVVSVNGDSTDVLTALRNLPKDEYLGILDELNQITGKKTTAASSQA